MASYVFTDSIKCRISLRCSKELQFWNLTGVRSGGAAKLEPLAVGIKFPVLVTFANLFTVWQERYSFGYS